MTVESLTAEIAAVLAETRALNALRWVPTQIQLATGLEKTVLKYAPQPPEVDRRCVELSERISRLLRFKSELLARRYSEGAGDWITPLDWQQTANKLPATFS